MFLVTIFFQTSTLSRLILNFVSLAFSVSKLAEILISTVVNVKKIEISVISWTLSNFMSFFEGLVVITCTTLVVEGGGGGRRRLFKHGGTNWGWALDRGNMVCHAACTSIHSFIHKPSQSPILPTTHPPIHVSTYPCFHLSISSSIYLLACVAGPRNG